MAQRPDYPPHETPPRVALDFLLTRIGSWTNNRWDQHLRHEFGDDATARVLKYLGYNYDASSPSDPAPQMVLPTHSREALEAVCILLKEVATCTNDRTNRVALDHARELVHDVMRPR